MLGLRTHIVRAKNIKEVADWYSKVFQTQAYFENESYIGFDVAGFEFGVFKIFPGEEIVVGKNLNIYWWVEDIEGEFSRIQGLWAKISGKITDVGGGIRMAEFTDPYGNMFWIIYNPNFKD